MNIALILAGGSGTRTGNSVPKQFITVNEIPIIVYTMQNIQKVEMIDRIVVSVADGWSSFVQMYAKQYNIDKLTDVIMAGDTRHQTVNRAVDYLSSKYSHDSKIVIVDANRPLIPTQVIQQSLGIVGKGECAVAVMPCYDTMYMSNDSITIEKQMDRTRLYSIQSPECAILSDLISIYEYASIHSVENVTTELFLMLDKTVHAVEGSSKSFKITTQDDLDLFKALINSYNKREE